MPDDQPTPDEIAARAWLHDQFGSIPSSTRVRGLLETGLARPSNPNRRPRTRTWIAVAASVCAIAVLAAVILVARHRSTAAMGGPTAGPSPTTATSSGHPGSEPPGTTSRALSMAGDGLSYCGDPAPERRSTDMRVTAVLTDPVKRVYSVSFAVADKTLWGKSLSVTDQIEIVRDGTIVAIVTNVSPILEVNRFSNPDADLIDKLTMPEQLRHCSDGYNSAPHLPPGTYQLYVEASAREVDLDNPMNSEAVGAAADQLPDITIK